MKFNIFELIKSKFETNNLSDSIQTLRRSIKEQDLPCWLTIQSSFKGKKFNSELNANIDKRLARLSGNAYRGSFVDGVTDAVKNSLIVLDFLEESVDKYFDHRSQEILRDGITYPKAVVLQYIAAVREFSEFARLLANYVLTAETSDTFDGALVPAQVKSVESDLEAFAGLLVLMLVSQRELNEKFETIPTMVLDESTANIAASTVGLQRLDPFGMRRGFFIPSQRNPFFWFGMRIAEWQVYTYEQALESRQMAELRLLRLRAQRAGKEGDDPKLDSQIKYQEDRLAKVNDTIRRKEAKYA